MKHFKSIIFIVLIIILTCSGVALAQSSNFNTNTFKYINYSTINELRQEVLKCREYKTYAHTMAECARKLGYPEEHEVIVLAKEEWHNADLAETFYNTIIENLKIQDNEYWADKQSEYPEATTVWRYLKELGYNDYICAGILGNMMAECGGQSLKLNPSSYSSDGNGYYGICQWSSGYSEIWDKGLEEQLDFLRDSIKYEFNTYGNKYQKDFNYEAFLNLQNEKDAALAFAKCYERCASFSHEKRQENATKAYEYFTSTSNR